MELMDTQPPVVHADLATEAPQRRIAWRAVLRRIVPWIGPVLVAGLYLWLAFSQLPSHRYQINPDGVGYISVARKYATGALGDAINAYWSPLYSWLIVPLLWLRIDPLLSAKLVGIGIGGATLAGMWRLMRHARVQADVRTIACAAAVPLVVEAVYAVTTSDLLVACTLLFYLGSMANPANTENWARGAWIGLAGATAYLAKAYALPFVAGHFALVRGIELIFPGQRGERRRLIASSLVTVVTMGLIVGAWGALLVNKYGTFMFGSTGRYNLRIDAPNSPGQVMHWAGFLEPADPLAISAWDDISWHIDRLPAWDPLATAEDREYLWKQVKRNFDQATAVLGRYTPVLYPILVIAGLVALSRADVRPRRPGLILAAGILLYPLGYLVMHIERRFLTPVVLMALIAGMYAVARASRKGLMSGWWRRSLAAAVLGYTFVSFPLESLDRANGQGETVMRWARELEGVVPAGATVASTSNWGQSLYLAFYRDWRYYGEPQPRQRREDILADLDRLGVEYLIAWRRRGWSGDWLERAGWKEVAREIDKPFLLYQKQPAPTPDQGE